MMSFRKKIEMTIKSLGVAEIGRNMKRIGLIFRYINIYYIGGIFIVWP
jgi:hypothetical protein